MRHIIESISKRGEHYLVETPRELYGIFFAAGGAGVITAFTAACKLGFSALGVVCANYVGSFLLMQLLGFSLATKQTSLLAVTFAERERKTRSFEEWLSLLGGLRKSLLAPVIGNVAAVLPAGLIFHFAYRWQTGHNFLSAEKALHSLQSFDVFTTLTIPYAALTGVLLWMSHVISTGMGAWIHTVLPSGSGAARWAKNSFPCIATNVVLGLMLALIPALGKAYHLPLDVRHVTLSTGTMVLAVASLGLSKGLLLTVTRAAFGIMLIGLLNLGISFCMAFLSSTFSRGYGFKSAWQRLAHTGRAMVGVVPGPSA